MKSNFIDEGTIEYQFISFCKAVLRNEVRNIHAEAKRLNERFTSLDELTGMESDGLFTCDRYETESMHFVIHGHTLSIEDTLLAEGIASLSKKQRDVILLLFFLEMKGVEIAELMSITQSTLYYHKKKAFEALRKFIEEES